MLPKIAEGDANKLWIVPSEIGDALKGLGGMGNLPGMPGNAARQGGNGGGTGAGRPPRHRAASRPPFDKD